MIAVDSSVLVAAFASWHEAHAVARRHLGGARLIGHCLVETYSVLTRLPPPHRVPGALAADFLGRTSTSPPLVLTAGAMRDFPARLSAWGITGGASYDALIATTAAQYDAELISLDVRAAVTYRLVGVTHTLLA